MVPSDFRCAVLDFALGLYEAPVRDGGCADGSLAFHADPCTRAATRTPPRPSVWLKSPTVGVAFAVTWAARPGGSQPPRSDCDSDEAAAFTWCCGPRACLLSRGLRRGSGSWRPASDARVSPNAGSLLLGASQLTEAGLSPAGSSQFDGGFVPPRERFPPSSRRTMPGAYNTLGGVLTTNFGESARCATARPSSAEPAGRNQVQMRTTPRLIAELEVLLVTAPAAGSSASSTTSRSRGRKGRRRS